MNTQTSKIEQADIEKRIEIVRMSIHNWTHRMSLPNLMEEEYGNIKMNLEREERNLRKLKDKYPEHFI